MATAKKRKRSDCEGAAADDQREHSSKRPRSVKIAKTKRTIIEKPLGDDLFRKLPGELRNKIYDLVLLEEDTIAVRFGTWRPGSYLRHRNLRWNEPGLLRASKWIRNETKMIYYHQFHGFEIKLSTSQFQEAYEWMHSSVDGLESEERYFNLDQLYITRWNWEDIHSWLAVAQIVRDFDIGFEEDTHSDGCCSHNHGFGCASGYGMWRALYEVSLLGYRAAIEKWDEVTLGIEFEEWVERKMKILLAGRRQTKERVDLGIGQLQRRMMSIEGGRSDYGRQADGFRGRGKKDVGPMTMRLRSRDA